ncbi:hypothetical protein EZS27_012349 [termite gut metagenome]|uniref:Chaperone protein DnaJ n=1 Tax=termite gut metagenome TaxID=433724 RepID=A0A5J4S3I1_9ZZZZ
MSKAETHLFISPPVFLTINNKESLSSKGHTCSYCHGNGFFQKVGEDVKERIQEPCPICQGSGKLKASITIEWLPGEKHK